jgi:citrate lyase subunit beta/citryl-CoA lyase
MSEQDFVRRSQLVTPAASEKMIIKALAVDCDSLVIDLEDAIAPGRKAESRQVLRNALSGANAGTRELGVRINGLETPWCLDDSGA